MPTLPNMLLITPTPGGDSGTWDEKINASLALIDAHDHTSGKGVAITVAALDIDADLPMASFGLTNVGRVDFTEVEALSSGAQILFVSEDDGELYWRNESGTNVKLTSGTSINTTLVGGIGGDYSSVGAELAFSDADQAYTFKDQSSPSPKWAIVACGPVRIYQNDTTESVYVEQIVDPALASSYTVKWPATIPATQGPIIITPAGVLEFLGAQTLAIPPAAGHGNANATIASAYWELGTGGLGFVFYPIVLPEGRAITGFSVRANKASDATNTLSAVLYKVVDGTATDISTQTNANNAPGDITLSATGLSETIAAGEAYMIRVLNSDATPSAADRVYNVSATYV